MLRLQVMGHLFVVTAPALILLCLLGDFTVLVVVGMLKSAARLGEWLTGVRCGVGILILTSAVWSPALAYRCFSEHARRCGRTLCSSAFSSYMLAVASPTCVLGFVYANIYITPCVGLEMGSAAMVLVGRSLLTVSWCGFLAASACSLVAFHKMRIPQSLLWGRGLAILGGMGSLLGSFICLGAVIVARGVTFGH